MVAQPHGAVRGLLAGDRVSLDVCRRSLGLGCSAETRQELMESYLHLDVFPEVRPALRVPQDELGFSPDITADSLPGIITALHENYVAKK